MVFPTNFEGLAPVDAVWDAEAVGYVDEGMEGKAGFAA